MSSFLDEYSSGNDDGDENFASCEEASKAHLTDLQTDTADAESGVEPDSNEWIFQDIGESVEFDITAEQAMATLRYFTSTSDRTNILTKTHHDDLDVISSLLQEKEKDLELAARIGQSLLQRNKNLLLKIEAMEDYVSNVSEKENQMKHEVSMKNELIKSILREEESLAYETQRAKAESQSSHSFNGSGCKDESMLLLEEKCKQLEDGNFELLNEALMLKDMARQAEEVEQDLVVDCVKHLAVAKEQITHLTDEIALKFEDNVAQQEEITELINMVVELQKKHKQLSYENDDLQYQLEESQQNQECLRSQLIDMQRRFEECAELLQENQEEVKALRDKVEFTDRESWSMEHPPTMNLQHDSLALEIEETVKRELTFHERNKERTSRVLEQVRNANRHLKPGSIYSASNHSNLSSSASIKSDASFDLDDRSVASFRSVAGSQDFDERRKRGFLAAEKLQIVKPMEGSVTLHKWHHLASENVVAGLNLGNVFTPGNDEHERSFGMSPVDAADPVNHSLTLSHSSSVTDAKLTDLDNELFEASDNDDDGDDFGITMKADKTGAKPRTEDHRSEAKSRQSTPVAVNPRSMENMFSSGQRQSGTHDNPCSNSAGLQALNSSLQSSHHNRSIITRNSSVLDSMREARSMLTGENISTKSKANAIDILANAMSKANVEAKTGRRILESVAMKNKQNRSASSPPRKDYQDMPRVKKVFEKLALNNGSKKVNLDSVKTPLKRLVDKAAEKKDVLVSNGTLPGENRMAGDRTASSKPAAMPALMAGPAGIRATSGIFGNLLPQSGSSSGQTLFSTVFSSNITAVGSEISKPKPTLSRSWSSGDIKSLNKDDLSKLGPLDAGFSSDSVGPVRRNSISSDASPSLSNATKSAFSGLGMLKRSNSSGSLSELSKQVEAKAPTGSPPKVATPFISFDNYGIEDYSFAYGSSAATSTSKSVTTTVASSSQQTTTTAVTAASKPTGLLRGLFLGSASGNPATDTKRPSSVHEGGGASPSLGALGKGSASSVESGMNRFGKALAQDDFGGFGFGFMSYFSGSKKPKS